MPGYSPSRFFSGEDPWGIGQTSFPAGRTMIPFSGVIRSLRQGTRSEKNGYSARFRLRGVQEEEPPEDG